MQYQSFHQPQSVIALSQEEVFALLEMCTLTLAEEKPSHAHILSRLGGLYRGLADQPTLRTIPLVRDIPVSLCAAL